ncbi:MAG: Crp/Fnr family transcriptional regulator [Spirochaetia bacterium]
MSTIAELPGLERFLVNFKAGDVVFCEYEIGDQCYMVQQGEVRLFKVVGEIEKTIGFLQAGDFFGEMALLSNAPRTATAVVVEDCVAYAFNNENFSQIVSMVPSLRMQLLRLFAKRIYNLKRQSAILKLTDIPTRVADVLIMLSESQPEGANGERLLPTNTDAIANWAGISVDSARKALKVYGEKGRVDIFPDRIVVKNLSELQRMVSGKRRGTE